MILLKLINAPGSIGFFLFASALGLVLAYVWPRRRALTRTWFVGLAAGYALLAMPVVAEVIAGLLPSVTAAAWRPVDAVIVFDGDNRRGRVREALLAHSRSPRAAVWVLGEDWVVDALAEAGLSRDRIIHDTTTLTTRAQVEAVARIAAQHPGDHLAVVASRLQMPRVDALARARSLDVTLLAAPVDDEPTARGRERYVPRYVALRVSRDALYEHAALAYYRWRGWIQ